MESLPRALHRIPCSFPPPPLFVPRSKRHLKASHFIPNNAGHSSLLATTPPLDPYIKGEPRRPPPHHSPFSFSSLHAQALPAPSAATATSLSPSPGRHTTARAPVRPEMDSRCTPLSIAPSSASRHALEQPLGRAPGNPSADHGCTPSWTSTPSGP
jgi:hypothetical protein